MAVVVLPNILTNQTLADASALMADFNAITAQLNGNLDVNNLANGAVTNAKLAAAIQGPLIFANAISKRMGKGQSSGTFVASASTTVTVTHGMPFTPTLVLLTAGYTPSAPGGSQAVAASV